MLNEAGEGLPAGSFAALQAASVAPDEVLRLNAGRAYLHVVDGQLEGDADPIAVVRALLGDVDRVVGSNPEVFVDNPLDALERRAFQAWFPAQRGVAVGVSHLRAHTRPYFIRRRRAGQEVERLEPGDILLERREWHFTNLGIPGYWTHAALYTGTPAVLDRYFEGSPALGGRSFMAALRERQPAAAEALAGVDEGGDPMAVIEALRPGVILTSLERSGHADSLAALRPRVSREDKLAAVFEALSHRGKPYDYEFDFSTDNALVCSELIWRAYRAAEGLSLAPESVGGRVLLSPNALGVKFDRELDSGAGQLELVLFLDGEGPRRIVERDAEAFRASWRRPKWHILLT